MKALLSISLVLLFITSCGSTKKTNTLKNDNNGTKSPRVKEIIKKTADNNKSNETITRYTYNKENLLISEKTSYIHRKQTEASDSTIITYTYNKNKQLKTRSYKNLMVSFNREGSDSEYIYSDIISKKTQLPVIDRITVKFREGYCVYKHSYILDASNFATSLDKINETCMTEIYGNRENPDYQSGSFGDTATIYSNDLSKHTEEHTYFSQSTIATYEKGLLRSVEYYSPDETNASKAPILTSTDEYIYENKPYFFKEYLSPMVRLPH